jgi:hypothetical protein
MNEWADEWIDKIRLEIDNCEKTGRRARMGKVVDFCPYNEFLEGEELHCQFYKSYAECEYYKRS